MLTERIIRDAKGGAKIAFAWDSKVKGFGLKIFPSGSTAFVLSYRANGRKRMATVGRPAEMSLKDARERAASMLDALRSDGTDPLAVKAAAKALPTVEEGVSRFFREFAPRRVENGRMKQSTLDTYRRQWKRTVKSAPGFARLRVEAVTRADIEDAIAARGRIQRNRVLAFLSRVFTYFESLEYRPQHSNPCRHVEKAREEARDRVLAASELAALAAALDAEDGPAVAAVRVAAVTGLRIGEVTGMEWEHIDMDTGRVLLPETKTGRRWHDLPDAALAILAALPRMNAYCFTNGRDAPITYKTARGAFSRAAKAAGLANVRLHDLRRSFATNAAAAGLSALQLQHLLGWKQAAMPARYVNLAGEATREARRALGEQVATMMRAEGNVVPLRKAV